MLLVLATACGDEAVPRRTRSTATTVVATRPRGAAGCPAAMPAVQRHRVRVGARRRPPAAAARRVPASHGCPAPVVVWVHGGGWQFGDKHNQINDKMPAVDGRRIHAGERQLPTDRPDRSCARPLPDPQRGRGGGGRVGPRAHRRLRRRSRSHRPARALRRRADRRPRSPPTGRTSAPTDWGSTRSAASGALDTEGYDVGALARTGNPVYRTAFGDDPATWTAASPIEHVTAARHPTVPRRRARHAGPTPSGRRLRDAGSATRGSPITVVDAGSRQPRRGRTSAVGQTGDDVITPPLEQFLAECFAATP